MHCPALGLRKLCSWKILHCSAAFKNLVDFRHVRLVVHHNPINLAPSMGPEWKHLHSDHHLGAPAVTAKKQRGCCRTLEAEPALEVKDTCIIHRSGETFARHEVRL